MIVCYSQVASEPLEMARLLWMLEQLMYDDILRGTGWGRKRGWFRDSLDKCRTLAQVKHSCRSCICAAFR